MHIPDGSRRATAQCGQLAPREIPILLGVELTSVYASIEYPGDLNNPRNARLSGETQVAYIRDSRTVLRKGPDIIWRACNQSSERASVRPRPGAVRRAWRSGVGRDGVTD